MTPVGITAVQEEAPETQESQTPQVLCERHCSHKFLDPLDPRPLLSVEHRHV